MADPYILCDNVVKIYKVANLEVFALQGLDLSIAHGEMLGIVGASGSGKSTLMNILGGLDRPSAGRVIVGGKDLLKLKDLELANYRRTQVGFVWQQGDRNLVPYLTAQENVQLPMMLSGKGLGEEAQRAEAMLEAVGLAERRHHRLMEMSGGEQQRVAIAVALANDPPLLLADEPTGEVDTATAVGIFELFKDLNHQLRVTTVIVSHDLAIARHVDRVVAIRDGKTSSETVRQAAGAPAAAPATGEAHPASHADEIYEEVVLLDSAGRLQVPREYLDQLNIKGRVYLELVDGGIFIRPAQASGPAAEKEAALEAGPGHGAEKRGLGGWWKRIRPSGRERRAS
jgi:putative ABC transport system ATP-binding protein